MKDQLLSLLKSDQFSSFLNGVELFSEQLNNEISSDDLDQEIIERVCSVMCFEKWAQQEDYLNQLERFITTLPSYQDLLADDEVCDDLKGISIFIDGLLQNEYNSEGFFYKSHNGVMMSYTASEKISDYLQDKGRETDADFFREVSAWFEKINSAQFSVISSLQKITHWNKELAQAFFYILTVSHVDYQGWMLGSLYKVVNEPEVKTEIFEKYLSILNNVKSDYITKGEKDKEQQVQSLIDMVEKKATGK